MKFHTEQAGLWLKPNTAGQLKHDMPQADISIEHIDRSSIRYNLQKHEYTLKANRTKSFFLRWMISRFNSKISDDQ